jgi:glucose-fructose oxidoreductase
VSKKITRKNFLKLASAMAASTSTAVFPRVSFQRKKSKLGVALVGLGRYSTGRLAPGLELTSHCELRGIVTGSPEKIPVWQERYSIPDTNVYDYESMHQIENNDDIDIVYIVLPPGLHARYSIIGAGAGKHVWCEKPMALTVEECRSIIRAAESNRVQLTVGYRMQHEPNTQTIIRYGMDKTFGTVTEIRSGAGFRGSYQDGDWRVTAALGGGALYDMGVYPINAARYVTGENPVAVSGIQTSERSDMFSDVDETSVFDLEFPSGAVARCETSFGNPSNYLDVDCTDGWYRLRPFQSYSGVQGENSNGERLEPDPGHQQARQMDNDAKAILDKREPLVPGSEGLEDIRIVEAVMESSRNEGAVIRL